MISQDAAAAEQEVGLLTFAVLFVTARSFRRDVPDFMKGFPLRKFSED